MWEGDSESHTTYECEFITEETCFRTSVTDPVFKVERSENGYVINSLEEPLGRTLKGSLVVSRPRNSGQDCPLHPIESLKVGKYQSYYFILLD